MKHPRRRQTCEHGMSFPRYDNCAKCRAAIDHEDAEADAFARDALGTVPIDADELKGIDAIMEAWVRELQPAGMLNPPGVEQRVQALARLMQHAYATVKT